MSQNNRKRPSRKPAKRAPPRARLYRPPQAIAPPHMIVRLRYPSEFILSGSGQSFCKRFNTNGALSPEVGVGTKPNGFAQWATIYNQYRVLSYDYHFRCANKENFEVYVYDTNSNSDPGTTATGTVAGRPNSHDALLSAKGGMDRTEFKGRYTINHIVGQNTTIDDKYSALANALPADVTWLGLGAQASGGSNLTLGVTWFGVVFMRVKFYDILPL